MTPNPVFNVTPLLDTEYITNGYRDGRSYCTKWTGNRTHAFGWHQFQWHWLISL